MAEGQPRPDGTDDAAPERARKRRSIAIAWSLALFAALVFVITVVRLAGNMAERAAG
ncbi:MAG: hypothetical protein HXY25_00980 [Alphaproteobacteria bacterium]|nr:hypothetical protein [Alphaproteobacteria bacterium]